MTTYPQSKTIALPEWKTTVTTPPGKTSDDINYLDQQSIDDFEDFSDYDEYPPITADLDYIDIE